MSFILPSIKLVAPGLPVKLMNKAVNQHHTLTIRVGRGECLHKILDKRLQAAGKKPFVLIGLPAIPKPDPEADSSESHAKPLRRKVLNFFFAP